MAEDKEKPVSNRGLKHFWTKAKEWMLKKITAEVTKQIAEIVADAPEDLDTLKEIADWIKDHADDAAAMNSQILENAEAIKGKADVSHTHSEYMPKSGGTFTGRIELPDNRFYENDECGINMRNSDIIGINSLIMNDPANDDDEGIRWKKSDGGMETLRVLDGKVMLNSSEVAFKNGQINNAIDNAAGRRLGGAFQSKSSNFNDLLNNELGSSTGVGGICGGSIYTEKTSFGLPSAWYNFLYIPHRSGEGSDNYKYGTLLVFNMTNNTGMMKIIHRMSGTNYDGGTFHTS